MVNPVPPTSIRIHTITTPDGKGIKIEFEPTGFEPDIDSPVFDSTLPDFDYTILLPKVN